MFHCRQSTWSAWYCCLLHSSLNTCMEDLHYLLFQWKVRAFSKNVRYIIWRTNIYSDDCLPTDGCYVASSEVEIFRVEGEAVILSFPMFARVLQVRNIVPPKTKCIITKDNGTEAVAQSEGRVQQSNKQLWLLPAKASDSGEYSCTYRYVYYINKLLTHFHRHFYLHIVYIYLFYLYLKTVMLPHSWSCIIPGNYWNKIQY